MNLSPEVNAYLESYKMAEAPKEMSVSSGASLFIPQSLPTAQKVRQGG